MPPPAFAGKTPEAKPPVIVTSRMVSVLPGLILKTRVMLLPLIVTWLAAASGPSIVRFLLTLNSVANVIVCGVANTPAVSNVIVLPLQAVAIASRSEQSPSQTPSFVSAIFVTTGLATQAPTTCATTLLGDESKLPSPE